MQLEGKIVALTGGFGGLGPTVVDALRRQGAKVAVIDRADAPAADSADDGRLLLPGIDIADADAARAAFERIAAHFGGVDALVNLAGTYRWEPLAEGSLDTWNLLHRVNLLTAVSATRAALPHLLARGGGRIVNFGALGALKSGAGNGPYAASKAGVHRLTESLAEELKDRGIQVNAILPSIIDTPANRADMPKADFSRWVKPAELAEVVVFLLSPGASAITGALIPVAGRV
ncbi:SDR family oxidoreductase [Rehaibacterium terrae]|jgi:NAD(P)-dependent dehydrogenase (short-subunit alcohol dehydrogenase family)|uniref:NAD(P)-dependent dehydrogenase (Short-subunit alcohol dehydrogenase family) n=1 Tax=Rehaibacterium terrae TaxID=1341696 RepID=A0A7W7XZM9_9GAMM|nr:SDR family oxidoreductase [Rehaibacterium terrae]MBB5015380.1 NAD(P)-dependent dehydrogenase (short-subunit alcohol dehydrogenase family) [Rehaibacterium terrae]